MGSATPGLRIVPCLQEEGDKLNDRLMLKRDPATIVQFIVGSLRFLLISHRFWPASDRKVVEKWALGLGVNYAGQMLEILLYGKIIFFALLEIALCDRLILLLFKNRHILRRFSDCPNGTQAYDTQMGQIFWAIHVLKGLDLPEVELIVHLQRHFAVGKLREEPTDAPVCSFKQN